MKHNLSAEIYVSGSKQPIIGSNYKIMLDERSDTRRILTKKFTVHAEEDAINKFIKTYRHCPTLKLRRMKLKLIVIRIDNNGNLVNAKPCEKCMILIKKYKIRNISYSNNFVVEKLLRI